MSFAITAQLLSCFFMTGVIWTIQVVHYPSFSFAQEQFDRFHKFHSNRITWIVLPAMSIELLSAALIVYLNPSTLWIGNLAGVIVTWAATAFLSVPQHNKLARSFDSVASTKLTYTNWVRTLIWTARTACLAVYLLVAYDPSLSMRL